MVGIFKANNPLNPFILFIYGFFLKLSFFIHPRIPVPQKTDGFLFNEILEKLQPACIQMPLIYSVIAHLLIFTQAITFNKLINNQRLIQRFTYLPAMSYLLITSMFPEWNILSAPLVINSLLIWVWARMSMLYINKNPKSTLFNLGLMIGLATFIYFPSLVFVLLIVFALIVSRPFVFAEWVTAFMGILSPYYFLFAYLFLANKLKDYKILQIEFSNPHFNKNYWEVAGIILVLITFLIGFFFVQLNFRKQLVQIRKSWSLILLYLAVAVLLPFINATHTFEYWVLTAIPLAAYIACAFFYPVKKWMPLLLHWLMVIVVIIISYELK